MAKNSSLGTKTLLAIATLGIAALALLWSMRTTARVAAATPGTAVNAVPGSVTVREEFPVPLQSEVGGRIIHSELDPGKTVKKGEILVQIDPADLDLEIENIQSQYEAAKKRQEIGSATAFELKTEEENLANAIREHELGSISEIQLARQRRRVEAVKQKLELEQVANQQQIESLENTLKVRKRQREKMAIVAPYDGVVSEVRARPGDLIGANTLIGTLISLTRTVEAKVSEENFSNIRVGQTATVRFIGDEYEPHEATVSKILPTADPETQRYTLHLDIEIDPVKLVPGRTGEVSIIVAQREAQTLIPRRALFGDFVYVVEDGRVRRRRVDRGYISLNLAEVVKGLNPGDLVVVDALETFRDGDRVRVEVVQ